jgi:restriction system protein
VDAWAREETERLEAVAEWRRVAQNGHRLEWAVARGVYMVLPTYEQMMLPILQHASDGREHSSREAIDAVAAVFQLSDEQRTELLPSGQQPILDNRANWARFYMTKAGLLMATRRGFHKITERGLQIVQRNPQRIDNVLLNQFQEFVQFKSTRRKSGATGSVITDTADQLDIATQTPHEAIEFGYQQMRRDLESELLALVKRCSPSFFERLVVDLLVRMGYGGSHQDAGQAIGRSGDGGIDGIIKEDKLGLDVVYIQAKRWDTNSVGRPDIQRFAGALMGMKARKGVFITTASFSNDAWSYVSSIDSKIVLIDGRQLAQLMVDNNIGVSMITAYEIKRVDSDYFDE